MAEGLPVWRSLMFVPVNVERFVEKAHTRGADALQLDLEDSIAPQDKESARALVRDAARRVGQAGADVVVRVNRPWRLLVRDLEASVWPEVTAITLPKVPDASHIRAVAEILDELEAERGMPAGHTRLIALIEDPDALFLARDICRAHPRLVAVSLGMEDFALAMGMEPSPEGLMGASLTLQAAARAAHLLPLGYIGSIADYSDPEKFRQTIRQARRLGFVGGTCIHPAQVAILNEEFAPTADEVADAEGMVKAYEDSLAAGRGSASWKGKMIDVPIVERAKLLLARNRALQARGRA